MLQCLFSTSQQAEMPPVFNCIKMIYLARRVKARRACSRVDKHNTISLGGPTYQVNIKMVLCSVQVLSSPGYSCVVCLLKNWLVLRIDETKSENELRTLLQIHKY